MKIKDLLEGWSALGKAIGNRGPKGHSMAKAVSEFRR